MTGSGASTANAGWPTTPRCALPQATAAPALSAARRRLAAAAHAARLSRPQTKKTHENGVGHKQAVEEFLKKTFSRGREERTEDKELQDELRAIEEAALKTFETDLRKKGVDNYKDSARQTMHDNRLSRQGVRPPPRRDWGGAGGGGAGGAEGEAPAAGAAAAVAEEIPEWKRLQLEAARQLELATLYYYIDAAGAQQGPHPLSSMQSWFSAGYFPAGTMVARDGDDEAGWVDVSQCYKITQQPDPAEAAAAAAAATAATAGLAAAGAGGARLSGVEERKAALGMSDQTADVVERRSAGSGKAAFQDKRAAMRKAKGSDANDVPLGKKRSGPAVKREAGSEGDGDDGAGSGAEEEREGEEGEGEEEEEKPELAEVKKGRDQKTGFGGWSTVTYKTAYTASAAETEGGHVYSAPTKSGDDSSGEEDEEGGAKVEARTEWQAGAEGDDGAEKITFKKRKLKGCVCACARACVCVC